MAGPEMDERRNNSRMRPSGEGVVLLQRGNREGTVRKHDPASDERGGFTSPPGRTGTGKVDRVAKLNGEGLTLGERLLVARRRSGESQYSRARNYGIHRNVYGRLERDTEDNIFGIVAPELGELAEDEICLILRRRSGLTQEECAEKLGVTRFWLNQMETGKVSCSELTKFWDSVK